MLAVARKAYIERDSQLIFEIRGKKRSVNLLIHIQLMRKIVAVTVILYEETQQDFSLVGKCLCPVKSLAYHPAVPELDDRDSAQ